MNKQDMLADYKKQDDKLCLAQVLDKIEISNKRNKIEYTDFLDMYQVSLVENFLKNLCYVKNSFCFVKKGKYILDKNKRI